MSETKTAHQFEILQLPSRHPSCFRESPVAPMEDYKLIYQGELTLDSQIQSSIAILEAIYEIFNINHPEGYTGRSLTTSDIVKLNGTYYLCQSIGWDILKGDQI